MAMPQKSKIWEGRLSKKQRDNNEKRLSDILDKLDSNPQALDDLSDDDLDAMSDIMFENDLCDAFLDVSRKGLLDYLDIISKRNNNNYVADKNKLDQMNFIVAWCQSLCNEHKNCKMRHICLEPKFEQGMVEIKISGNISIDKASIEELKEVLDYCDGMNITGYGDQFLWTFYVNDVWIEK